MVKLMILDLRKMRKVEIDLESKNVTAQGGCVAADIEQPLEGGVSCLWAD
jgi:FAD/FMN-containing dehydrogenase